MPAVAAVMCLLLPPVPTQSLSRSPRIYFHTDGFLKHAASTPGHFQLPTIPLADRKSPKCRLAKGTVVSNSSSQGFASIFTLIAPDNSDEKELCTASSGLSLGPSHKILIRGRILFSTGSHCVQRSRLSCQPPSLLGVQLSCRNTEGLLTTAEAGPSGKGRVYSTP